MKKIVVALLTTLMVFSSLKLEGQGKWGADSANCLKYISFYEESFKAKDYDNATSNWRKAYKSCPRASRQTILTNGSTLLRKVLEKNRNNPEYKAALIDSLFTLNEERAQYFPKSKVTALNNKGIDIVNYFKGDQKAVYDGLNDIIARNGEATNATLFINNLDSAIELFKAGTIGAEDVINTYQRNIELLEKAPSANAAA